MSEPSLQVLVAGADNLERRRILAESAQVAIAIEGGPGTAEEIAIARAAGVPVLPLARTGGASAEAYERGGKPAAAEEAQWRRGERCQALPSKPHVDL